VARVTGLLPDFDEEFAMASRTKQDVPNRRFEWFRREAGPLLLTLLLLMVARTSFANHYVVPTGSMEPTLLPGDRVVVDMTAYGVRVPFTQLALLPRGTPQRGDIAVFKSPSDGTRLIKRVVAVAGDAVELRGGHLAIDGVPLATSSQPRTERFGARRAVLDLDDGGGPDIAALTIPPGKVLVLGDHRGNSADGRVFGLVDAAAIYARAVGVYYRRDEGLVWKAL
jgi:signal peptidase I